MGICRRYFNLSLLGGASARFAASLAPRPKLLVLVVLEQVRQEYWDAVSDQFGPGGLRRILSKGAHFPDCRHLASSFSASTDTPCPILSVSFCGKGGRAKNSAPQLLPAVSIRAHSSLIPYAVFSLTRSTSSSSSPFFRASRFRVRSFPLSRSILVATTTNSRSAPLSQSNN